MTTCTKGCTQIGLVLPISMAFPKYTKSTPCHIQSFKRGLSAYGMAQKMAGLLQPLLGKPQCHIQKTQNFL